MPTTNPPNQLIGPIFYIYQLRVQVIAINNEIRIEFEFELELESAALSAL